DAKLASDEIAHHPLVLVRYPRPDALQGDDVEFRQIRPSRDFGEGIVEEFGARAGGIGKRACVCYVTWVKIGTPEFAENGRGVDVKRQPQAIPELEITQRLPPWRRDTGAQASEAQHPGTKFAVITEDVVDLGDVAGRPVHRAVRRIEPGSSRWPFSRDGATAKRREPLGGSVP